MEILNGIQMHKGIDTSRYNEVVDWNGLKAQGVEFAIIRSGQGPSYKDPYFLIHRNNAIVAGVPWGVYHFYDYRWTDGVTHFQNMSNVVGSNFGNIAPCVDLETLYSYTAATKKKPAKSTPIPLPGRNTVYTELMEFGSLLKQATGKKPMLYVGNLLSWLKPDQAFMELYDLWFAYWNAIPGKTTPYLDWLCWQRTGDIVLPGQKGVWDINYVKDKDWTNFIGNPEPEIPTLEELSIEEKVEILWAEYQETH
jgi:lysozyme